MSAEVNTVVSYSICNSLLHLPPQTEIEAAVVVWWKMNVAVHTRVGPILGIWMVGWYRAPLVTHTTTSSKDGGMV